MGNSNVRSYHPAEMVAPGHHPLIASDSSDRFRTAIIHFTGVAHPHDEVAEPGCRWISVVIRSGRWYERHFAQAWAERVASVWARAEAVESRP